MARIQLCGVVSELHGRLNPNDNYYYKTRNGKVFTCRMPEKRTRKDGTAVPKTTQQVTSQERFSRVQQMTNEVMHSPTLRAMYAQHMRNQRKYHSLRGYVFALLYQQL